jgi:hypothetical protein
MEENGHHKREKGKKPPSPEKKPRRARDGAPDGCEVTWCQERPRELAIAKDATLAPNCALRGRSTLSAGIRTYEGSSSSRAQLARC